MKHMEKTTIHLLCNAHIDPVWLWSEFESTGVTLSTFRSAATLCETHDDFIFNHNEALVYRWVQRHEPALFDRIKRLVGEGRWVIIGGFEMQPDSVMPGGEAYLRQIMSGRRYFEAEFGARPTVAVNFDPFGHSRGMVQLLCKSGYTAYLFKRPEAEKLNLPKDFVWVGPDGSEIMAHRLTTGYNSQMGKNREELEAWLAGRGLREIELYPWGVGNHGGGPSRKDIEDIARLRAEDAYPDIRFEHSTPERYFEAMGALYAAGQREQSRFNKSLYSSMVGCYTSVPEVKQAYRRLEGALLRAEKLAALACLSDLAADIGADRRQRLADAWQALAFLQFHDALPGSHTAPVTEDLLDRAGYGLELARQVATDVFFAMAACQPPAGEGEIPLLVLNPHPYPVRGPIECSYVLPDQNWDEDTETLPEIWRNGSPVPAQLTREDSNVAIDWCKKVVFEAELPPASLSRFDCRLIRREKQPAPSIARLTFETDRITCSVDPDTGLLGQISLDGQAVTANGLGAIAIHDDNGDPWRMDGDFIDNMLFCIPRDARVPVRVVEDGPVRIVVEACFAAPGISAVTRYGIPRQGCELTLDVELTNTLDEKMVKLLFPMADASAQLLCETMFNVEDGFTGGRENVSQRFDCLTGAGGSLGVINDGVYGGSFKNGVLMKSLLRSPAFAAHPIAGRNLLPPGRNTRHSGIGRYCYHFTLCLHGREDDPVAGLTRRAQALHEAPLALAYFPGGDGGTQAAPGCFLTGAALLSALKPAEDGPGLILRLYAPTTAGAEGTLTLDGDTLNYTLGPCEIKTWCWQNRCFTECNLIEEPLEDVKHDC